MGKYTPCVSALPLQVPDSKQRLDPVFKQLGELPDNAGKLPSVGQPSHHWRRLTPGANRVVMPIHRILPNTQPLTGHDSLLAPKSLPRPAAPPKSSSETTLCDRGTVSEHQPDTQATYKVFRERLEEACCLALLSGAMPPASHLRSGKRTRKTVKLKASPPFAASVPPLRRARRCSAIAANVQHVRKAASSSPSGASTLNSRLGDVIRSWQPAKARVPRVGHVSQQGKPTPSISVPSRKAGKFNCSFLAM
jgi:hypothetical protein